MCTYIHTDVHIYVSIFRDGLKCFPTYNFDVLNGMKLMECIEFIYLFVGLFFLFVYLVVCLFCLRPNHNGYIHYPCLEVQSYGRISRYVLLSRQLHTIVLLFFCPFFFFSFRRV